MKAKVFFHAMHAETLDYGQFVSLDEALREGFVRIKGCGIVPTDGCSYIYWYPEASAFNEEDALAHISMKLKKPYTKKKEEEQEVLDMRFLSTYTKSQILAKEMGWEVTSNGLIGIPPDLREHVGPMIGKWVSSFYTLPTVSVAWLVFLWATDDGLEDSNIWAQWLDFELRTIVLENLVDAQRIWLDEIFMILFDVEDTRGPNI